MKLRGELVVTADLDPTMRESMFRLMDRYYQNVRRDTFLRDLAEKQWVILLSDPSTGGLCGFSSQMLLRFAVDGRDINALYSGDTIIAPEHWGDVALSHVWGQLALNLIDKNPLEPLYWFLISKGYKTYRFLPLFFHEYYPRYDQATPSWAENLIHALGRHKFPQEYDPSAGVVRASGTKDSLRAGIADLTQQRLHDPHVRYFGQRNPGYIRGDELCCIAPLTRENFTPAAYRVINAGAAEAKAL